MIIKVVPPRARWTVRRDGPSLSPSSIRRSPGHRAAAGRVAFPVALAVVVATALVLTVLSLLADTRGAPQEIVLVARGMAFRLDGDARPNPPLVLRAGARVRLVLRNDDAGFVHNFAVPAWELTTPFLRAGEEHAVEFRVPDRPGRYDYRCTPHGQMMRGTIEVAAR